MKQPAHVVQVRITRAEWALLSRLAATQETSIEELIRRELGLESFDVDPQPPRRHLQLVRPGLVGATLVEERT